MPGVCGELCVHVLCFHLQVLISYAVCIIHNLFDMIIGSVCICSVG